MIGNRNSCCRRVGAPAMMEGRSGHRCVLLVLSVLLLLCPDAVLAQNEATPSPSVIAAADETPPPTALAAPDLAQDETTPSPSVIATADETPPPTALPASDETPEPTPEPTLEPSPEPSTEPTPEPTLEPTPEPTTAPSPEPTSAPSPEPTPEPTASPTSFPTESPTSTPTGPPTTLSPTETPTSLPTSPPTTEPTLAGTVSPTMEPTVQITSGPTTFPTPSPTITSTASPTTVITASPTVSPTDSPSLSPVTEWPSPSDTGSPTISPSMNPTISRGPTQMPSASPSSSPTDAPDPIALEGDVGVILFFAKSEMSNETAEVFRSVSQNFLTDKLGALEQPIINVEVKPITEQELGIPQAGNGLALLTVYLEVTGAFRPKDGFALTADEINMSRLMRNFFNVQSSVLVNALMASGDAHFNTLTQIRSVEVENDNPGSLTEPNGNSVELSPGIIVAIAMGGLAMILLLIAAIKYASSSGKNSSGATRTTVSGGLAVDTTSSPAPSRDNSFWAPLRKQNATQEQARSQKPPVSTQSSRMSYIEEESPANSDYNGSNSRMGSFGEADSYLNGGGTDTLSYAYSLDAGIEDASTLDAYDNIRALPSDDDEEIEIGLGNAALLAAASAAAADPPTLALSSTDDANDVDNEDKITRECFAPPGRLGIVVDSTLEGPRVVSINEGSPLEGVVWSGDYIVAIDAIDTSSMSASAVGELMASTMGKRRKLTLVSDA